MQIIWGKSIALLRIETLIQTTATCTVNFIESMFIRKEHRKKIGTVEDILVDEDCWRVPLLGSPLRLYEETANKDASSQKEIALAKNVETRMAHVSVPVEKTVWLSSASWMLKAAGTVDFRKGKWHTWKSTKSSEICKEAFCVKKSQSSRFLATLVPLLKMAVIENLQEERWRNQRRSYCIYWRAIEGVSLASWSSSKLRQKLNVNAITPLPNWKRGY